ncbi:MAG: O-succinylhomoserine sulfhydrylase, partial [Burkholderiaceae bacterium]|nr:O-succinylhomoserine sulfhydrylase [Burkholderiaceae bacterium]
MTNKKRPASAQRRDLRFATRAVRAGTTRSEFGEHSEAMYLTSSFVFDDAEQAAARFQNREPGMVYSRFTNPSVQMFEERLASLENAERCVATSSGMSAILATCMGLLKAGDHIVSTPSLFGATVQLFDNYMVKFGVSVDYVSLTDPQAWAAAVKPNTRLFYLETPSNPLTEIADVGAIAAIAKAHGSILVVDNCFCTPALQQPLALGADLVLHSATKYLDGQGRVIGGAVAGTRELIEPIFQMIRTCGPSLSPFNAWVLHKGLETLDIRMHAHSTSALVLARWLEQHPAVQRVFYPGLESHPQHRLAMKQQSMGGAIVSFEVKGETAQEQRRRAHAVIDAVEIMSVTGNLGDTRTTITHPASTTHGRIAQQARDRAGIRDSLIRVAVGLEDVEDLKADLD